jgi:DNA-binding cell septation regulator SpoVG
MQIHYYVREDIVVDGVGDINFVTIFVVVRIDYHRMNDGLFIAMSTSRVVGDLSFVNVFTASTSMNTMNHVLLVVSSANEQNVFVHVPNTNGCAIDFEDTF